MRSLRHGGVVSIDEVKAAGSIFSARILDEYESGEVPNRLVFASPITS